MKVFLKMVVSATIVLLLFLGTSCILFVPTQHHDNGKHKGWYKKSNNPHNPSSPMEGEEENQDRNKNNSKGKNK